MNLTLLGLIADSIAILGIPVAIIQIGYLQWQNRKRRKKLEKEEIRLNAAITVVLRDETSNKKITLPAKIWRREINRAEVLGRLGAIPYRGKDRFYVSYAATSEFISKIDKIYVGDADCLEIICRVDEAGEKEIDQFDLAKLPRLGCVLTGFDS